jgi:putative endonuclease
MNKAWVYIIANKNITTFYIGVTNNIERRMLEHKASLGSLFASKYKLTCLLFQEELPSISDAIKREKQLKNWHQNWKLNLIKEENPELIDLAREWFSIEEIDEFKLNQDYISSKNTNNQDSETSSE